MDDKIFNHINPGFREIRRRKFKEFFDKNPFTEFLKRCDFDKKGDPEFKIFNKQKTNSESPSEYKNH